MALFKIFKGNATGKITDPNNPEYIQPTAATDGYAYYDTSTRKFYINADYNNDGTITRQPINAYHADGADAATLAQAAIYETTGEEGASVNSIRSYYAHNLSRSGDSIQLRNGLGIDIGNNIDISDKQDKNFIVDFYDRQYESDYVEGETKRYQVNFDLAEFRRVSALQFGKCNLQAKVSDIDQTFVYTNYYLITFIFFAIHVFYSIDISMEGLNLNAINGIKYRYFAFADTGSNTIPDNNIYRGEITVPSEETIESYLSQALANYVTQNSLEEQLGDYPTWDDLDFTLEDYLYNTDTAYKTASIPMGQVDNTSTSTVFTATIDGITELRDGVCVWLTNGVVTSASGFTININGLGAKPCYSSLAAASRSTTIFNINYTMLLIYNSTRVEGGCWDVVYGYDSNTNTQMRVYRQTTGYNGDYPLLISRTQASGIGTAGTNGSYSAIYGVMWNDTTKVPTLNPSTGKMKVPGGIEGNASSATGFAAQKSITMTGAITGSGSGGNGSNGWSISTTIPDNSISNNKLTNNSINIAGTNVSLGGSINATTLTSSLGLTNAMHFIGVSSTTVTNEGNENPTISGYSTKTAGDVVLYGNQEFVYTKNNKWVLLGDEGSYKIKQEPVSDPTTTGTDDCVSFISSISQNANGVISATKKNIFVAKAPNTILAGPSSGTDNANPTFRELVAADIPSLTTSKISDFPTEISSFNNDAGYLTSYTETDPTVPSWAKAETKPSYNLTEINSAEDINAIEILSDTATGFLKKTGQNEWILDNSTYVTSSDLSTELAGYLPLTGGEVTGDITLKAPANSDSPSLIFQRGTLSDNYNDWRLIDNGGILRFQERANGSTAWASKVAIQTAGITADNVTATNNMYATTYKVNNKLTIQYNSTTDALEFVFAS